MVINSVIEDICGDFGVQFYLHRDGTIVWLGVTQQHFDASRRWSGGSFSANVQSQLRGDTGAIVEAAGRHLHNAGYFGLVGIDILRDEQIACFSWTSILA